METVVVIFVIFILIVIIFVSGMIEERKLTAYQKKKISSLYGKIPSKKYADNRLQNLASMIRNYETGCIDDITWNDLDMDRIFQRIDYTQSAAGEEALYTMLRKPIKDEAEIAKQEKHISFFQEQVAFRSNFLFQMKKIGHTGRYTIYDYLNYLDIQIPTTNMPTLVVDGCIILFLLLGITLHLGFLIPMCFAMAYHGSIYFKKKKELEPYLTTFAYVLRVLDEVATIDVQEKAFVEEFRQEISLIQQKRKKFRALQRFSYVAMFDKNGVSDAFNLAKIVMTYLNILFHLDILKLYSMIKVMKYNKDDFLILLRTLGNLEAYDSIAYFRSSLVYYSKPIFVAQSNDSKITFCVDEMYHPLIANPIANSITTTNSVLLTGSNASGKSTFLKTVAINAVLAQTIATVCAKMYEANQFMIYSSMALRDNLSEGDSYFVVEIKSIKRIFDASLNIANPILCTIDEVLRGTNTSERIAASTELLRELSKRNVLCLAATHDMELTSLLEDNYTNYHFTEKIKESTVEFPYELLKGPATGRNAIKLMEVLGFDKSIVEKARKLAGGNNES